MVFIIWLYLCLRQKIPSRLTRFDARDVGYRDGRDPGAYAKGIVTLYGLERTNPAYHADYDAACSWLCF